MFSSRVSTGRLLLKVRTPVALTLVTLSMGQGNLKFGPGCMVRAYWPKRSTTPRSCSPISWKLENSTSRPMPSSTQRSGLPPPPMPPNRPRRRSTTSPMPPPPCGLRGFQLLFRLPLLPDPPLPLPGVFQAMPTPYWKIRAAGAGAGFDSTR